MVLGFGVPEHGVLEAVDDGVVFVNYEDFCGDCVVLVPVIRLGSCLCFHDSFLQ